MVDALNLGSAPLVVWLRGSTLPPARYRELEGRADRARLAAGGMAHAREPVSGGQRLSLGAAPPATLQRRREGDVEDGSDKLLLAWREVHFLRNMHAVDVANVPWDAWVSGVAMGLPILHMRLGFPPMPHPGPLSQRAVYCKSTATIDTLCRHGHGSLWANRGAKT